MNAVTVAYAAIVVSIRVVDNAGHAIAHATVSCDGPQHASANTDARGSASLALERSGIYTYRVSAPGYRTQTGTRAIAGTPVPLTVMLEPSAGSLHVIGSVTGHARAPFNATPVSQKIYPREAYRDQGQPSTSSVMNETPGLFALVPVTVNPGAPLATSYASVRNALPFETPVSLDGEPISLPSSGTLDLSLIPTFALQEVEAVKGPGDIAGDGGGTGGAINFRTAEPTLRRNGTYEIDDDARGGSFTDLAYDGTEPGGKLAFATMLSADGTPCCAPIASDLSRNLLLFKVRSMPSSGVTMTATAMSVNEERSAGSLGDLSTPAGGIIPLVPQGRWLAQRLGFIDLVASVDRGSDAFAAHVYGDEVSSNSTAVNIGTQSFDTTSGASLEWQHVDGDFSYGVTGRVARGNASSNANGLDAQPLESGTGETTSLVRASASLRPTTRSEIDASIEDAWDAATFAPTGSAFTERTFVAPQARLAWSQLLQPGLSLRAAAGSSAVLPPLDALSGSPEHFLPRVINLERANGGDIGIEWQLHGHTTTLSADLYRTATTGVYTTELGYGTPLLPSYNWVNGPAMVESGAEITLQQFKRVGLGFIAALDLPRTYTATNPSNISGAYPTLGFFDVAPYRIPYARGYGELSYKWPRGSRLSMGALYLGSNNVYGRPAFVSFVSNLELSLGARSKLQLSAENLFDTYGNVRLPVLVGFPPSTLAGMTPLTVRFMFRQSFGEGALYEH